MTAQTATERLGNLGYGALIKEPVAGTPQIPTVFFPVYKSSLGTDLKLDKDNPVMGVRSDTFNVFPGTREHVGQIEVLAEPNTAKYFLDMLLSIGNVSGAGPYTWPFTEGLSNSYTMEFLKGQLVERYFGVMAESIEVSFDKNKAKFTIDVSARGSLVTRKIATVSTSTITLNTSYDQVPNKGFCDGDIVRILKSDNSNYLDTTIASSGVDADGITLRLGASAGSFAAGDSIFLRGQTPSYSILTPFEWGRTEFRFGSTASGALSATHLPEETSAKWKIMHPFEKKSGSDRSGSRDPNSLVRLQTGAEITLKTFFDQPTQNLEKFFNVTGEALVIRMFSGSGYELRLTFDQVQYLVHKRELESAKIIYADVQAIPVYNQSNGEGFNVKVLNNLSS